MRRESEDIKNVKLIRAAFKRDLTQKDREEEELQEHVRHESEEISKNPLEVAEFIALYLMLIASPLLILGLYDFSSSDPHIKDMANSLLLASIAFSAFGAFMAFATPVSSIGILKSLFRLHVEIGEEPKNDLWGIRHQEYQIFSAAVLMFMFLAINNFLFGYMPGHYDVCIVITAPVTIGIILLIRRYLGGYLLPLYNIIEALPLNLRLFYIFLMLTVILLPYYFGEFFSKGIAQFAGFALNATVEIFFLSLLVSCFGVFIELVLFLGIRYGFVGTLSSLLLLFLTYIISGGIVSIAGSSMSRMVSWYEPVYVGAGVVSLFLGFYKKGKRNYEWYAAFICLLSSVALVSSREFQYASIFMVIAALVILTLHEGRKRGGLTLNPPNKSL
jgi:hypothetical protein